MKNFSIPMLALAFCFFTHEANGQDNTKAKPKILAEKTWTWGGSKFSYAKCNDLTFEVGMGNKPDGVGCADAGVEIENVRNVKLSVDAPPSFNRYDENSFAGFMVDYHTSAGYTKRVGLSIGMHSEKRWAKTPIWGKVTVPNQFVDLGKKKEYDLDLQKWAPDGWDGKVWFVVSLQNTGRNTAIKAKAELLGEQDRPQVAQKPKEEPGKKDEKEEKAAAKKEDKETSKSSTDGIMKLTGTEWRGKALLSKTGELIFRFGPDGKVSMMGAKAVPAPGEWKQEGADVTITFNKGGIVSVYKGKINDNSMSGHASNNKTAWMWKVVLQTPDKERQLLAAKERAAEEMKMKRAAEERKLLDERLKITKKAWDHMTMKHVGVTPDGIAILNTGVGAFFQTKETFKGPISITTEIQTARNNVRLYAFNGAMLIFNWEKDAKKLVVHRPDGIEGRLASGSVSFPSFEPLRPNQWHTFQWRLLDEGMEVLVNGKAVYYEAKKYDLSSSQPVGVTVNDSILLVKSFRVERIPKEDQRLYAVEREREKREAAEKAEKQRREAAEKAERERRDFLANVRITELTSLKTRSASDFKGVRCLTFSPDSKLVLTGGFDGKVTMWDVSKGEECKTWERQQRMRYSAAFSPDGKLIAVGDSLYVRIVDAGTGKPVGTIVPVKFIGLGADPDAIQQNCDTYVAFSPDGTKLAIGQLPWRGDVADEGFITVTSTTTWKTEKQIRLNRTEDRSVEAPIAFSPDATKVTIGHGGFMVDIRTGQRSTSAQKKFPTSAGRVGVFAYSPDYDLWALSKANSTEVSLWDINLNEKLKTLTHSSQVTCLVFSPNGRFLAVGCNDGLVKLWELTAERKNTKK